MPISNDFSLYPVDKIQILRATRQRRVVVTEGLRESIARHGVLQPIIVTRPDETGQTTLMAGERRLTAAKELNLLHIPVRFHDALDTIELQLIELEENAKRLDLSWQDTVASIGKIHLLLLEKEPTWTQAETAEQIGCTPGWVSRCLRVFGALADERIASSSTLMEAYNLLARRDNRAAGEALDQLVGVGASIFDPPQLVPVGGDGVTGAMDRGDTPTPPTGRATPLRRISDPSRSILHESFTHWAPKYSGPRFSIIHCDFPYGIGVFNAEQGGGNNRESQVYSDTEEIYFSLLHTLCSNLDRLMSTSGHLIFWYSEKHKVKTLDIFEKMCPGLKFAPHPLIWHKTDNVGIVQDVRRTPRHVYETALLASRGNMHLVKVVSDVYGSPTDKRLHPSAKPEPMLRHFLSLVCDDTSTLLDPTCGSASSLRAAESLGAKQVLGMDIDETTVGLARTELGRFRSLRGAL